MLTWTDWSKQIYFSIWARILFVLFSGFCFVLSARVSVAHVACYLQSFDVVSIAHSLRNMQYLSTRISHAICSILYLLMSTYISNAIWSVLYLSRCILHAIVCSIVYLQFACYWQSCYVHFRTCPRPSRMVFALLCVTCVSRVPFACYSQSRRANIMSYATQCFFRTIFVAFGSGACWSVCNLIEPADFHIACYLKKFVLDSCNLCSISYCQHFRFLWIWPPTCFPRAIKPKRRKATIATTRRTKIKKRNGTLDNSKQ